MILRYFTRTFDYVNSLISPRSPSPTDEPRLDPATLARLLILLPALLVLCGLVWVLIVLSALEGFVRACTRSVAGIARGMVRGYSLIRRLWNYRFNTAYGRRFRSGRRPHASIEQEALWDRWLDGY
jgi:hypothetical protein